MALLRCTRRLFEPIGTDHRDGTPDPGGDNRLGTWTATLLPLRPARLVVAVSEHARLPLVMTALPYENMLDRFPEALYALLLDLKLPPDLARLECAAMQPLQPVTETDGSTLAVLKIYAVELRAAWEKGLTRSSAELSLHLAQQTFEHMEGATPAQAARRRFHLLPDRTEPLGL